MKKVSAVFLLGLAAVSVSISAQAQSTPKLDQREARQEQRIDKGIESGQLTQREANRLERREVKLKTDEAAAKADGVVTKQEHAELHAEANRDSARIYRQKHDRQHDFNHNGVTDHRR